MKEQRHQHTGTSEFTAIAADAVVLVGRCANAVGRWIVGQANRLDREDEELRRGRQPRAFRKSGRYASRAVGGYAEYEPSASPKHGRDQDDGYGTGTSAHYADRDHIRSGFGRNKAGAYQGYGPKNYRRSDERIREELCEQLNRDDAIDASEVEVDVENGVVRLSGRVRYRWMKHHIEDMAEACSGVVDVQDALQVSRRGADVGAVGAADNSGVETAAGVAVGGASSGADMTAKGSRK